MNIFHYPQREIGQVYLLYLTLLSQFNTFHLSFMAIFIFLFPYNLHFESRVGQKLLLIGGSLSKNESFPKHDMGLFHFEDLI